MSTATQYENTPTEVTIQLKDQSIDLKELLDGGELNHGQALEHIRQLTDSEEGIRQLYDKAADLDKAGIFADNVWKNPKKLVPSLTGGTLMADHPTATLEIVSDLRMLAYGTGKATSEQVSQEEALDYLEQMIVHNLNFVFDKTTAPSEKHQRANRLLKLILEEVPFESLKEKLAEEVVTITAQRPILTKKVKDILKLTRLKIDIRPEEGEADETLAYYLNVVNQPTEHCTSPEEYEQFLKDAGENTLMDEAKTFGQHLQKTGLASSYHVQLIKRVYKDYPDALIEALAMTGTSVAEYWEHQELVNELIEAAIVPQVPQGVYGLSGVLDIGILSHRSTQNALHKLMNLEIHPEVAEKIQQSELAEAKVNPNQLLMAGTLNVLGQPLGVGQGNNPTCQSVRAISLWSDQAPVKLLDMIITAARANDLEYHFEGDVLQSSRLPMGVAEELYLDLDPVSIVLVPHLDKIYNEMMKRTTFRGEDGHKWVNPSFYGHWIPTAFMSAFNAISQMVTDYDKFVRTFYATQHPYYNGGYKNVFANPLGIIITSAYAEFAGFHAISLLRVDKDPEGKWRAYFLNPQNEGRQNWGQGIKPSVEGHGEQHGESSLPFDEFVSRVYGFHYNALQMGDPNKVDAEKVNKITKLAKESWGQRYYWV